ncbi:MAG: hypothetical protein JWQ40_5054 [Segetibacter sp.]|jgi:hypothetical protein|nr:hypothetical protein [Segetibacter sp.]
MVFPDYKQIFQDEGIASVREAYDFINTEIIYDWADLYKRESLISGDVTIQNFQGFTFAFDHTVADESAIACALPDSRVVAAFGIANISINFSNRAMMRKFWGPSTKAFAVFGDNYDKGHFIAHNSGGPIDINLFPHRRDINRGWSKEGKKYRLMERHVAENRGTVVFSRPVYNDFSCCPAFIEYGYFDTSNKLEVDVFPNKNELLPPPRLGAHTAY